MNDPSNEIHPDRPLQARVTHASRFDLEGSFEAGWRGYGVTCIASGPADANAFRRWATDEGSSTLLHRRHKVDNSRAGFD